MDHIEATRIELQIERADKAAMKTESPLVFSRSDKLAGLQNNNAISSPLFGQIDAFISPLNE